MQDPTGDAVRPTLVDETMSRRSSRSAPDGRFDLRVPPSTRPFLVNEKQLEDFEVGDTEAYTVVVRDADGAEAYRSLVTVDRGFTAEVDARTPAVVAIGVQDPDPTPGA